MHWKYSENWDTCNTCSFYSGNICSVVKMLLDFVRGTDELIIKTNKICKGRRYQKIFVTLRFKQFLTKKYCRRTTIISWWRERAWSFPQRTCLKWKSQDNQRNSWVSLILRKWFSFTFKIKTFSFHELWGFYTLFCGQFEDNSQYIRVSLCK